MRWMMALVLVGCGRLGFDPTADAIVLDAPMMLERCPQHPNAFFCDDFEGPNLAAWLTTIGNATRVDAPVHTGTGALRVISSGNLDHAYVDVTPFGALTGGSLNARAWFYVPSGNTVTQLDMLVLVNLASDQDVTLTTSNERVNTWRTTDQAGSSGNYILPRDRWFCVELSLVVADSGMHELWVDDVLVYGANLVDTLPTGGFASFAVGATYVYPTQGPVTIHVDDVVVSPDPIDCN